MIHPWKEQWNLVYFLHDLNKCILNRGVIMPYEFSTKENKVKNVVPRPNGEMYLEKMALVLIILTLLASGCGSADVGPEPAPAPTPTPIAEHEVKHETVGTATSPTVYDDPTTYRYNSSDVRFVVVDY